MHYYIHGYDSSPSDICNDCMFSIVDNNDISLNLWCLPQSWFAIVYLLDFFIVISFTKGLFPKFFFRKLRTDSFSSFVKFPICLSRTFIHYKYNLLKCQNEKYLYLILFPRRIDKIIPTKHIFSSLSLPTLIGSVLNLFPG